MKKKDILSFLAVVTVTISCSDTGSGPGPPSAQNLIPNESFEVNRTPTLQGWRFGNADLASVTNEAPPGGGEWSLKLAADWAPTMGFAYTSVKNLGSGDRVKLSAYVRAIGSIGGGVLELRIGPSVWSPSRKSVSSQDTLWTELTVIDTLAFSANDSLWVVLSSFNTEIAIREGLFDLVRLDRLSR